ncbi:membrane protein [Candidatus Magnetoovum chiemensis]|nr:membrane protein [Candidatus Magnetoovum chiemensis]
MKRLVNVLTVVVYLLSLAAISTGEVKAADAAAKVKHKPVKYFVPEHRIIVNAEVSDPAGVNLVRCYFKASAQADYVFVGMQPSSGGDYQGILPAPDKTTKTIEYLFLVLNNKKQVVKTQKFTISKNDSKEVPSWQNVGSKGNIQVSTEVPTTSETLTGFKDSIAIDLVESSARLGLVAGGIYAVHAASAGGAVATSAGTVTASTGMSKTKIAGIGAGIAAVVAIAALSGGSDDKTEKIDDPPYCPEFDCKIGEPCEAGCGGGVDFEPCNKTQEYGGPISETRIINVGEKSGTFQFTYNTIRDPDEIIIYYPADSNNILWRTKKPDGTYGPLSTNGSKTESISYSGNSATIKVTVIPEQIVNSVTQWSYTVNCPQ